MAADNYKAEFHSSDLLHLFLDVDRLDACCDFWRRLLGFDITSVANTGLVTEVRHLRSPQAPGVVLHLRNCAPRPATGCSPGAVRRFAFLVEDVPAAIARLQHVRWIEGEPEEGGQVGERATVADPCGYIIELGTRLPRQDSA